MFFRALPQGRVSYPIPTNVNDISANYIRALRKKFQLTELDGVSDYDFYEG